MSEAWAGGSTREYRENRRRVLLRDGVKGFKCRAHDEGWCRRANAREHVCERIMVHAHHVRGKAAGDAMNNLVGSCAACNYAIGDPSTATDPACTAVSSWS